RNAHDAAAGAPRPVGYRLAPIVVDTHNPGAVRVNAGDQPFLNGSVVAHAAVTVEMVLGQIDQDADRRLDAGRKVDLKRRTLDHMHTADLGRSERQDRCADIAAELGIEAGLSTYMSDERRRGRLTVGSGDGNERGVRRIGTPLAAEQLDI